MHKFNELREKKDHEYYTYVIGTLFMLAIVFTNKKENNERRYMFIFTCH